MQYFNAVLRPDIEFSKRAVEFVDKNLKGKAEGYCLSDKVLPHVTLCQFKAAEVPDLSFDNIQKAPDMMSYNVRKSDGIDDGYVWVEILVDPEAWLHHLHTYTKNKLDAHEVEILTIDYVPHLTLCRAPIAQESDIKQLDFPDDLLASQVEWKFEIGQSDINGQYFG